MDLVNIFLYKNKQDHYHHYTIAYIESYKILFDNLKKDDNQNDFLWYPALYLLYQSIELTLKNIIYYFEPEQTNRTHDLQKLWEKAKPKVEQFSSKITYDQISFLESYIQELCRINKYQQVFRYPDTEQKDDHLLNHIILNEIQINQIEKLNYILLDISDFLNDMRLFKLSKEKIVNLGNPSIKGI